MDSVGAGELPDAKDYNDTGANTLKHIAETAKGLNMPHMQALGLGNLTEIEGVAPIRPEKGYYTKCEELSVGKDTMTGHWEIMGLKTYKATIGDSIMAWFCPTIPVQDGPGLYNGLPGLILDLEDTNSIYSCTSINTNSTREVGKPKRAKEVTEEEFEEMRKQAFHR